MSDDPTALRIGIPVDTMTSGTIRNPSPMPTNSENRPVVQPFLPDPAFAQVCRRAVHSPQQTCASGQRPLAILRCAVTVGTSPVAKLFNDATSPDPEYALRASSAAW